VNGEDVIRLTSFKPVVFCGARTSGVRGVSALWPAPERLARLRIAVTVAIGALRLTKERWAERGGAEPRVEHLRRAFADMKAEIGSG
jgi:hypothetical protein